MGELAPPRTAEEGVAFSRTGDPGVSPPEFFLRFLMPNSAFGAIWARK